MQANSAVDRELRAEALEDLCARVDDWKNHRVDHFGELLQHGHFPVVTGKSDVQKEVRPLFSLVQNLSSLSEMRASKDLKRKATLSSRQRSLTSQSAATSQSSPNQADELEEELSKRKASLSSRLRSFTNQSTLTIQSSFISQSSPTSQNDEFEEGASRRKATMPSQHPQHSRQNSFSHPGDEIEEEPSEEISSWETVSSDQPRVDDQLHGTEDELDHFFGGMIFHQFTGNNPATGEPFFASTFADERGILCPHYEQYTIYLFERILLCCKDLNPNKSKDKLMGAQKDKKDRKDKSRNKEPNKNAKLQLKGRIFMTNVTEVMSLAKQGK